MAHTTMLYLPGELSHKTSYICFVISIIQLVPLQAIINQVYVQCLNDLFAMTSICRCFEAFKYRQINYHNEYFS